jgi:hypothetical protein
LNEYVVQEWTTAGVLRREIRRTPEWFISWDQLRGLSLSEPPDTIIQAVFQDEDQHLWVLSAVPATDWQEGMTQTDSIREGGGIGIGNYSDVFDTYIDVIDVDEGSLVVSQRVPQYLHGFTNRGNLIGYEESESGYGRIDIWKASIVGR